MEKILVTTDQSDNSKAAIRFAIKLAKARKAELIILHIYHLMKPFNWSEHAFEEYTDAFKQTTNSELTSFIGQIFQATNESEIHYELALSSNIDVVEGIINYASLHQCNYICISTRGAGTLKKIFGTHTSKLIANSAIPVISIPHNYHVKEIKSLLYATDMTNYASELEKVVRFARPLAATIEMMHIFYPYEYLVDEDAITHLLEDKLNYTISIRSRARDITNSLLEEIDTAVKHSKPSILVMFTHQSRSIFDKFFAPENAAGFSFYGNIPLLTFSKNQTE